MDFKLTTLPSETSVQDIYAHQLTDTAFQPQESFEIVYEHPHYNQKSLGICTAADLIDMVQKLTGKVFSMRFQYLGQKKIFDKNNIEGSSILNACKMAYTYGLLPIEFDPDVNNVDMTHEEYLNKTYTAEQFAEASKYKITAYARVALDPLNFAIALQQSKAGLMTRMAVGDNFYRPSWRKIDLEPLRAPQPVTGGHSIKAIKHKGLTVDMEVGDRNTWGDKQNPTITGNYNNIWCDDGDIKFIWKTQQPYLTEAYVIYMDTVKFTHIFKIAMKEFQETCLSL